MFQKSNRLQSASQSGPQQADGGLKSSMKSSMKKGASAGGNMFYASCVLVAMAAVLALSLLVYLVSPRVLNNVPLYFPTSRSLQNMEQDPQAAMEFSSELHAIPRVLPRAVSAQGVGQVSAADAKITYFVRELLLGPRSIYMVSPVPELFTVRSVLVGGYKSKTMVFVEFAPASEAQENTQLSDAQRQRIERWLSYNVSKYFFKSEVQVMSGT